MTEISVGFPTTGGTQRPEWCHQGHALPVPVTAPCFPAPAVWQVLCVGALGHCRCRCAAQQPGRKESPSIPGALRKSPVYRPWLCLAQPGSRAPPTHPTCRGLGPRQAWARTHPQPGVGVSPPRPHEGAEGREAPQRETRKVLPEDRDGPQAGRSNTSPRQHPFGPKQPEA